MGCVGRAAILANKSVSSCTEPTQVVSNDCSVDLPKLIALGVFPGVVPGVPEVGVPSMVVVEED